MLGTPLVFVVPITMLHLLSYFWRDTFTGWTKKSEPLLVSQ